MGRLSTIPPAIANTSSRAEAMKLTFEAYFSSSFWGMSPRQIAIDLMVVHAKAVQAMAAILDHTEDSERVNRLQAEQKAAHAELAASRVAIRSLEEKYESLDGSTKNQ
ncbi:hypothetical protein F0562_001392 [Nyssa sinensis]|uniref:Uncharacterized protein n=1 Tax=Nyssa sinensis TaxID=561372 RepID=A0A5J5C6K0_9ASTE|nr:hypothetical protein F0562_001392 [Nyssa sinensis]